MSKVKHRKKNQGKQDSTSAEEENLFHSTLGLSGVARGDKRTQTIPGDLPGIDHLADDFSIPDPSSVTISFIDYSATKIESGNISNLDEFLKAPLPEWVQVRWLNVSHLHPYVINQFRQYFEFHTLAAEDVLHIPQRPRTEVFDDHIFVVLRILRFLEKDPDDTLVDLTLDSEQVSLFLYDNVLITFQEKAADIWQPIRERLQNEHIRIRKNGAGYLLYTLLDAVVDHYFPVLEQYGDTLEELELEILENPTQEVLHRIHAVKRELSLLRRILWPMREVVDQLYREDERIGEVTKPFLRDVYEHTIQIVEIIESYREMASSLTDLYMSAVSNRMNEIMKVLTIMASVFIPLTFLAGVYGMNFNYMPELNWKWAYPAIWGTFAVLTIGMLFFFKRRGWLWRK
ncbi:magnesium/cobalt transporter CorA [Thalassotalea piscium]